MADNDCAHAGHYWVDENLEPFVRHRGRPKGLVPVMCSVCGTTTELEGHSPHTAPPQRSTGPALMP